jgi:hypothetical protein
MEHSTSIGTADVTASAVGGTLIGALIGIIGGTISGNAINSYLPQQNEKNALEKVGVIKVSDDHPEIQTFKLKDIADIKIALKVIEHEGYKNPIITKGENGEVWIIAKKESDK